MILSETLIKSIPILPESIISRKNFDVEIGEGTKIHSSAVIGNNVKIRKNTLIFPNVVIGDRTEIGDNVIIQSNTVLGGDAFYYRKLNGNFDRLISVGNVVIENNVEIKTDVPLTEELQTLQLLEKVPFWITRFRSDMIPLSEKMSDRLSGRNCRMLYHRR